MSRNKALISIMEKTQHPWHRPPSAVNKAALKSDLPKKVKNTSAHNILLRLLVFFVSTSHFWLFQDKSDVTMR